MNVGSLFSGIGGLDLGLERAGMRVIWQCEIDPYCRAVLAHHWPDVPCYADIKDIDGSAERVDLICGGFPCQPVSVSGRRRGSRDERWLWPEMFRVIEAIRPKWVVAENVRGIATRGLAEIMVGLETAGYQGAAYLTSACAFGAPHPRERVFIVADLGGSATRLAEHSDRRPRGQLPDPPAPALVRQRDGTLGSEGRASRLSFPRWSAVCGWDAPDPLVRRMDDGFSGGVAQLRALGNAVVPQVAEAVGRMILESTKPEAK